MKILWDFVFEVPTDPAPVVRDTSAAVHNALVEVVGMRFTGGELENVLCVAKFDASGSEAPVVYRASDKVQNGLPVIPDRKEVDQALPKILARAKAEALVRAAELCGLPYPVMNVRAMLEAQEEFIKDVDDIYGALYEIDLARVKGTAS